MNHMDASVIQMIIDIMDIRQDSAYIENLINWVHEDGAYVVLEKIIRMYSLSL